MSRNPIWLRQSEALRNWLAGVRDGAAKRGQRFAARVAGQPDAPIANGLLIFYMAFVLFMLVLAVGALQEWHNGAGKGSVFVDVLGRIVWIVFNVLAVTWVVLLVIWISRWFNGRGAESGE
jgi:hypothetical protein